MPKPAPPTKKDVARPLVAMSSMERAKAKKDRLEAKMKDYKESAPEILERAEEYAALKTAPKPVTSSATPAAHHNKQGKNNARLLGQYVPEEELKRVNYAKQREMEYMELLSSTRGLSIQSSFDVTDFQTSGNVRCRVKNEVLGPIPGVLKPLRRAEKNREVKDRDFEMSGNSDDISLVEAPGMAKKPSLPTRPASSHQVVDTSMVGGLQLIEKPALTELVEEERTSSPKAAGVVEMMMDPVKIGV